jgi:O-antigen/teichoic acid export membrane protein
MTGVGTAAMVAVAAAGELAPMILGKSYAASNHTALVLSLALPLMAIQYLAGDVLSGSGHQRLRATVHFVMALVSSMILAAGAALAGVQGVLIAFVASQGLVALVMWGVVLRAE